MTAAVFFEEFPEQNHLAGLTFSQRPGPNRCLCLLRLAELAAALPESALPAELAALLAAEEQERYAALPRASRRVQWLGGRLVAKQALGHVLRQARGADYPPEGIVVIPGESGEPLVRPWPDDDSVPPLVSISHGGDFALALAACRPPCGVDIQQVVPTLQRVRHRFCTDSELAVLERALPALDECERLGLLWSAKEAGKKALFPQRAGIAFLRLVAVAPDPPGWRLHLAEEEGDAWLHLHGRLLNDHCLAWTGEG
ncbi:MAG: hypothetical protein BWK76_06350 [Desulfobulbaceae bacterium A2]|nr:MAG: hypothetical protein BWK76_06350 [Desulfobulbaceae bacterium A2]